MRLQTIRQDSGTQRSERPESLWPWQLATPRNPRCRVDPAL
jgi:hypothetical protein